MSRSGADSWLSVEEEGERVRLRTGARYVGRRRLALRVWSGVAVAAGLALAVLSPWTVALAALGLAGLAAAPRLFGAADLLEVDRAAGRITGPGGAADLSRVEAIRGVNEINGWTPRDAIYAVLDGGEQVPILLLGGTNEPMAEEICRTLGRLSGRPATYAGPFEAPKVCFDPSAGGARERSARSPV